MLNQITNNTEVKAHTEKNLTSFTVDVGLHPKDVEKILDIICEQLKQGCADTKRCVEEFNKERDYLTQTLNLE